MAEAKKEKEQEGGWKNPHTQRFHKKQRTEEEKEKEAAEYPPDGPGWTYRVDPKRMRETVNPRFISYYKDLHSLVGPEQDDWDSFMSTMRTPLPTTIWINDLDPMAPQVSAYLSSLPSDLAAPIPWYPLKGMGWRINVEKVRLRRDPECQPLRRFLITQTASGTISRQEEVSMIPVFLLDIQPTDCCFDMCASPGSKTAQMLVSLCRKKALPAAQAAAEPPFDYKSRGCVIANELDFKRANMLIYQVKRLRPLFPFALFTNHDARFFPCPKMSDGQELEFDKILCDVVCSGDGTLRKAPHIVGQWKPSMGLNLQPVQVQIALRGCHALKVGGRMVYSTCSLNPIENEAVVTQLIHRTNGAVRLVDVTKELLPGLNFNPGFKTWTVVNAKGEVCTDPVQSGLHKALFPMDPPPFGTDLSKCVRLLPHHCNGGGFFVAVLEKVAPFKLCPREVADQEKAEEEKAKEKRRQARLRAAGKKSERDEAALAKKEEAEEARVPHSRVPKYFPAPASINVCWEEFYQSKGLPHEQLMVRSDTTADTTEVNKDGTRDAIAYFTSSTVHEVLMQHDPRCTFVSAGVRAFKFERMTPRWRVAAESASIFSPLLRNSPRLVNLSFDDVKPMLYSGPMKDVLLIEIANPTLKAQCEGLELGPLMFIIQGKYGPVACPGFRARSRIQLFVDNEDMVGLKNRLGVDLSEEEIKGAEEAKE